MNNELKIALIKHGFTKAQAENIASNINWMNPRNICADSVAVSFDAGILTSFSYLSHASSSVEISILDIGENDNINLYLSDSDFSPEKMTIDRVMRRFLPDTIKQVAIFVTHKMPGSSNELLQVPYSRTMVNPSKIVGFQYDSGITKVFYENNTLEWKAMTPEGEAQFKWLAKVTTQPL